MGGEWARAGFVAERDAFAGGDFADAGERRFEFFFPGVEQRDGVLAGDGEEEFEVFAVGERGEERRFGGGFYLGGELRGAADGDRGGEQFRANAAGFQNVAKVTGEAVA